MYKAKAKIKKIEAEAWAVPAIPLDQFIAKMRAIGNTIIEVDRANNRVKLAHSVKNMEK